MLGIQALYRIGLLPGSYSIRMEGILTVNLIIILAYYHFGLKSLGWIRPDLSFGECLELADEQVELMIIAALVHA